MNTLGFLAIPAEIVPEQEAVVSEGRRFTYAETLARVRRFASALARLGVGRGTRVAALDTNSHRYVEAYYAAAMLGAVFIPLNYRAKRPARGRGRGGARRRALPRAPRGAPERASRAPDGRRARPPGRAVGRLRGAGRGGGGARLGGRRRGRRRHHPHVHERHDRAAEGRDAHLRRLHRLRHRQRRAGGRHAARRGAPLRAALPHRRRDQHDDHALDRPAPRPH
ncbi:MAG: hypothetical protein E6J79_15945, partial [Deltaproteobacteria bacterium]